MCLTSQGFNKHCFLNPGIQVNMNNPNNVNDESQINFKCCPDKKANILVCQLCESIYHQKCAKKLNFKSFSKIKAICCSLEPNVFKTPIKQNFPSNSNACHIDHVQLQEFLDQVTLENINLKDIQKKELLSNQKSSSFSQQDVSESSEINNLRTENHLYQTLYKETKDKIKLLEEKVGWLNEKLERCEGKKSQKSRRSFRSVLKRKKKKFSPNSIETLDL